MGCPRHLIRNVTGQPLRIGVYIDEVHDIGRVENVHFNPFWCWQPHMVTWMGEHGEAFVIGSTDWQYLLNTFCLGYNVGYHFIQTSGLANGNFLGIAADRCLIAVQVDNAKRQGIRITNGQFVSLAPHKPVRKKQEITKEQLEKIKEAAHHFDEHDPTAIVIGQKNRGSVRLVNCTFWGKANRIAKIAGKGVVGFSDCSFREGDKNKQGLAAIQATGGTIMIRGCEFNHDAPQIEIGKGVNGAIVTDNVFVGEERIHVAEGVKARVEGNLRVNLSLPGPEKIKKANHDTTEAQHNL